MSDITRMLDLMEEGERLGSEELFPLVYQELRSVAAAKMAHEGPQTLQPTALVHEVWLKLAGSRQTWKSRGHFFGAAAEAMRRILIDKARKRNREKHGGGLVRIDLSAIDLADGTDDGTLLLLDEALGRLAEESPGKAELVKLRYFGGLSIAEAARALGISEATAKRQWAYARAWLYCELTQS